MSDQFDWSRYGPTVVWTLVFGIIATLLKAQGSRYVHQMFRAEDGRALDTVLHTLESTDGRARLRTLMDDIYAERIRSTDAQLAGVVLTANASRDSLAQVVASQMLHGGSLRTVEEKVREVPRLIDALESLATTTESISKEMQQMNLSMARMDEREKERERRFHNVLPNPGRREGE